MTLNKIESTEVITPEELKEAIKEGESLVIIDVRQPEQYQVGHLPGAVNIPLINLVDRLSEFDPEKDFIITYCNGGNSGDLARKFLLSEGFNSVRNLSGGYKNWTGQGK
ncbi:MAG: rhodanese-like domain-containing protein [Firmicutes bacterium]|nr:rhodanese-like domain-containing protein [Bacillota bacterium]